MDMMTRESTYGYLSRYSALCEPEQEVIHQEDVGDLASVIL
jgi:hypothetical protein